MTQQALYHNGSVLPLDNQTETHSALVTDGSKILGVGSTDDMRALADKGAVEVDLDGACLLPGLVDSHPHAMHFMGYQIGAVNIMDATCFDDIVAAIRQRAAVTPKGQWIVCTPVGEAHYFVRRDYTALQERRLPDRRILDAAAPDHPVWIMAWAPRTPNITAFNSQGLKLLGIGNQTPEKVCTVEIEHDDNGPTGILRGSVNNYYSNDPYWAALSRNLPQPPDDIWEIAGIGGVQAYNQLGVTALYEAHAMMPPHLEAYNKINATGLCTARVVMSPELSGYAFSTMDYAEQQVMDLLKYGHGQLQLKDNRVRTNGVTFGRGGPLSQGYLRMNDPYPGPFGEMTTGHTFLSHKVERKVVRYCLNHGVRLNMVLGGYRDADEFIDTLRGMTDASDVAAREWVLQHCYFTAPEHIKAYKEFGFHITTSASFVYGKSSAVAEKFPQAFAEDFVAMQKFVDAGLNLACGSDWGPDSPWQQMALNETREDAATGEHHLLPGNNALNRLQSLQSFSRNGAKVMQWPEICQLRAGALADLVIVDRNPLTATVEDLAETQVLRTIVDGEAVYDNASLVGGPMALPPAASDLIEAGLKAMSDT